MTTDKQDEAVDEETPRRRFLTTSSKVLMAAGLAGGYGAFGAVAGRYLYPAAPPVRRWVFVAEVAGLAVGDSILFRGPSGERISVTRQEKNGDARDFIALSSTCPHLGCQVHWEARNDRFFCPCHNGTFDASGVGTGGPPGDAGQTLPRYELQIDSGMLFISVASSSLAANAGEGEVIEVAEIAGPGHDPCLAGTPRASHAPDRRFRKA